MKTRTKVFFTLLFSLLCCCLCIGYAQLSDTLVIEGGADVVAQKNVFITNVEKKSGVAEIKGQYGTVLSSNVTVTTSTTTTLEITLFNNSEYVFVFNGTVYDDAAYSNKNVTFSLSGLKKGDEIAGMEYLTFTVTFATSVVSQGNLNLSSALNFQFVPREDYIPEIAVSGALDQFEEILNEKIDYDELIEYMEDTANTGRPNSSYIGNVVGADSKDSAAINEMFTVNGENMLVLDINGKKTNVTAMIKKENVDGNANTGADGDEMTIYMTAADLTKVSWGNRTVQVFAAVFTKASADAEWVQIGQMFEGTATANNYEGSWFGSMNSFNTDTWKSSAKYYGINSGANIETLVSAAIAAQN